MSIRKRGNQLVIDFRCYLPDGRRVRCVETSGPDTEKNRKHVERKHKAIEYALSHGRFDYLAFFPHGTKAKHFENRSEMMFSDWWNQWLREKSVRPGTESNYRYQYENHIEPHFGHLELSEIDQGEILVFRKRLEGKGLKASTINVYLKPLCQALLAASKRGLIPVYPCLDIGSLSEARASIDPLSFDELKHWLDYLSEKAPEWYDMILFWSRTGLRPGELYALRWEHVDFFNKKAMIREAKKQSGEVGLPKTNRSIRDVDLRPTVIDALKRQQARTGLMGQHVFLDFKQTTFAAHKMLEGFRHWMRLAGLKYRPPKQMRHTFATLHLAAGEQIGWVAEMMGHSDPEITWKKYYRFIPNLTRDDGSAFEKIMDSENQIGNRLVTSLVTT